MRVYRSSFRASSGEVRSTPRWYVEVVVRGRARRMAGYTDRAATVTLGRNIERLAQHAEAGGPPPSDLTRWLDTVGVRLRGKLASWGLLDERRAASGQPLEDLLAVWREHLEAKGCTEQHVRLSLQRAAMVLDGIGARRWADVDGELVERYLSGRRAGGLSVRSSNHMLTAARGFARWMVRTGRAGSDPLAELAPLNAETDRRRRRRALTPSEARRLIRAAESSPRVVDRMTGEQRALVYRVALGTGLRRAELARLRVGDFDLDRGLVAVPAASTKNRRAATLPLPAALVLDLRERFAGEPASKPALPLSRTWRSWRVIEADRRRAGIPRLDERGREIDFHALRVTYVSWLAAGGAHASVAQALARHSDGRLTQGIYTDLPAAQVEAVAGLPDLSRMQAGNSASHSADGVSGHGRPSAVDPGARGQGWRRHPDLNRGSRICNPFPVRPGVVDLSGVTSFTVRDWASHSADEELEQIRGLVSTVTPPGVLAAMEWAAGGQA